MNEMTQQSGAPVDVSRAWTFEMLSTVLRAMSDAVPQATEVVVHDLAKLPDSVVDRIGERVTDGIQLHPTTYLLLQQAVDGTSVNTASYETRTAQGFRMTSSLTVLRDLDGDPLAAICVNRLLSDTANDWLPAQTLPSSEELVTDVGMFAREVLKDSIASVGVPVAHMKKRHKLEVVRALHHGGLFFLRDGVEITSEALGVTKFTIYNYLNELGIPRQRERRIAFEEPETGSR